ncbi:putative Ufm1-specific protease [Abeliophyllum distichum]|uniref:Ufm1-specific protease n=1 Tax=Abeliophyllum distichum TaxID=126358 RepID=A0ABD1RVB7_9LAMI
MEKEITENVVEIRILCRRLVILKKESGIQWLIGSPFLPSLTIVSTLRCLHTLGSESLSPDLPKESDDLRSLLPKGFEVIGALITDDRNDMKIEKIVLIGAVIDLKNGVGERDVRFFMSRARNSGRVEKVSTIVYEDQPEKFVWDKGCIVRCELPIRLSLYYPLNTEDVERRVCTSYYRCRV